MFVLGDVASVLLLGLWVIVSVLACCLCCGSLWVSLWACFLCFGLIVVGDCVTAGLVCLLGGFSLPFCVCYWLLCSGVGLAAVCFVGFWIVGFVLWFVVWGAC